MTKPAHLLMEGVWIREGHGWLAEALGLWLPVSSGAHVTLVIVIVVALEETGTKTRVFLTWSHGSKVDTSRATKQWGSAGTQGQPRPALTLALVKQGVLLLGQIVHV